MTTHAALSTRQISSVLSPRATRVLDELGVQTVGQLESLNPSRIPPVLGAGPKTIREIVRFQESLFGPYNHPVKEEIEDVNPDARTAAGLEDALIGYTEAGRLDEEESPLAAYDCDLCVEAIMDLGKIREDAEAHLKGIINKLSRLGDNAPVFVVRKQGCTSEEIIKELKELNPNARLSDGQVAGYWSTLHGKDEYGLIGYTQTAQGRKPVAVYDSELYVKAIMANHADEDENEDERLESAEDYLSYNVFRNFQYWGENAPVFINSTPTQSP